MKFEIGETYYCYSTADYNCTWKYVVIARTDKTVTLLNHDEAIKRKITIQNGIEVVYPKGRYSMAPKLTAKRKCDESNHTTEKAI